VVGTAAASARITAAVPAPSHTPIHTPVVYQNASSAATRKSTYYTLNFTSVGGIAAEGILLHTHRNVMHLQLYVPVVHDTDNTALCYFYTVYNVHSR